MGTNSKIEWTDHTWNPWRGCSKVASGCQNCYAERESRRNPKVLGTWGPDGMRPIASDAYWHLPQKWDRDAAAAGVRRRVFCGSLMDWLEDRPDLVEPRGRLLATIDATPHLDWLLLTKRPANLDRLVEQAATEFGVLSLWSCFPFPNVRLGYSASTQEDLNTIVDGRSAIAHLLISGAPAKFLSLEPLLGPIVLDGRRLVADETYHDVLRGKYGSTVQNLAIAPNDTGKISWVIAGGESGPHARPCHPDWVRLLRDQCQAAGVPFVFKQWGEYLTIPMAAELGIKRPLLEVMNANTLGAGFLRVGKNAAGRLLDGREWMEFPEVNHARTD